MRMGSTENSKTIVSSIQHIWRCAHPSPPPLARGKRARHASSMGRVHVYCVLPLLLYGWLLHEVECSLLEPGAVVDLTFTDADSEINWVSGNISWGPPDNSSLGHTRYAIYFVPDLEASELLLELAVVPVGTNSYELPRTSRPLEADHLAVFSMDMSGNNEVALGFNSIAFVDSYSDGDLPENTVTSVFFNDTNPRCREAEGILTWSPGDEATITGFAVYFASSENGTDRLAIDAEVPKNVNSVEVNSTIVGTRSYLLIYTTNENGESLQASAFQFSDLFTLDQRVTEMDFQDTRNARYGLAGALTWTAPSNMTGVEDYEIWLGVDEIGTDETSLGQVASGTDEFTISVSDRGSADFLLVYTTVSNHRQECPASFSFFDKASQLKFVPGVGVTTVTLHFREEDTVTNVAFTDTDSSEGFVKGWITWENPDDLAVIQEVRFFFAVSDTVGEGTYVDGDTTDVTGRHEFGGASAARGETQFYVEGPEDKGNANYLHVYIDGGAARGQTDPYIDGLNSPTVILLKDYILTIPSVSVSDIIVTDTDPAAGRVAGFVNFTPPSDFSTVDYYRVFFGSSETGSREFIGDSDDVAAPQVAIPESTYLRFNGSSVWDQVLVFTANARGLQVPSSRMILMQQS